MRRPGTGPDPGRSARTTFAFDPAEPAVALAERLLGAELWTIDPAGATAGRIVETEAYGGADDAASHAFRGRTPRNGAMFGPAGTLYVYRSYGIHWCANVAAGPAGEGTAVLIRAVEPVEGMDLQWGRRPKARTATDLGSGPGKVCAALGITGDDDGRALDRPEERVRIVAGERRETVVRGPRVGISKAVERPWRFALDGNPHVSRPRHRLG